MRVSVSNSLHFQKCTTEMGVAIHSSYRLKEIDQSVKQTLDSSFSPNGNLELRLGFGQQTCRKMFS